LKNAKKVIAEFKGRLSTKVKKKTRKVRHGKEKTPKEENC